MVPPLSSDGSRLQIFVWLRKNTFIDFIVEKKKTSLACSLAKEIVLSPESTRKNNKK
jgi:hypothetical protein